MQYSDIVALLESSPEMMELMRVAVTADKWIIERVTAMLTGQPYNMQVEDIQIFPCFMDNPPKPEKMERKTQYFEQTGYFQSEIILDEENNLIDEYTSYLLAVERKMKRVPIRYGKRQTIRAYHRQGGKLYEWELPQKLIDRVSAGDKVLVHTEKGVCFVTVAAVEQYGPQERTQALRRAIRVNKGGVA